MYLHGAADASVWSTAKGACVFQAFCLCYYDKKYRATFFRLSSRPTTSCFFGVFILRNRYAVISLMTLNMLKRNHNLRLSVFIRERTCKS